MGYWKNQLIAEQVEVGDRLPAPKPASAHVALALPTRKQWRMREKQIRDDVREMYKGVALFFVLGLLIGVVVGFAIAMEELNVY